MSKQNVTGPIFFDLVDAAGNQLTLGGTTKGYAWSLGLYSNLYIVPGQASDLICSGYGFGTGFAPSYRAYFDGNGWVTPPDSPNDVFPITLVAGDVCNSYYVMKNGQYLQSTPASTTAVRNAAAVYSSNKYQWLMKQTAGQAFQLQNNDGTYVVASLAGFSSDASAAKGTIFEWCTGSIVIYDSFNATTNTANYLNYTSAGVVSVASGPSANLITPYGSTWTANPQGSLYVEYYVPPAPATNSLSGSFPITSSTIQATITLPNTTFDATTCARVVEPTLLQVDPAKLFIYAAGMAKTFLPPKPAVTPLEAMPYADPTPYTFNMWVDCPKSSPKKSSKKIGIIIGASAGGVVLIAAIIVGVLYWKKKTKT